MLRINQIKIPVCDIMDKSKMEEIDILINKIQKLLKNYSFEFVRIVKKSLDAREKKRLIYIYSVDVKSKDESIIAKKIHDNNIMLTKENSYCFPVINRRENVLSPVIIGAGPAGYFCALYLARAGYAPIVIERGKSVDERTKDVQSFWSGSEDINPASNVSFGEGGAGTFSDGKLNTGIKDPNGRIQAVLNDFIIHGANDDIAYINKPHIGTDVLCHVMKNIREEIISLGGEVRFQTTFLNFEKTKDGNVDVRLKNDDKEYILRTKSLVLALGHSARDTFRSLVKLKLPMEQKAFAIGLRIEHDRDTIDKGQYGTYIDINKLPAADYKMTYRSSEGRSVYSFCMCPGGFVVNASSDENQAVVNGMSNHGRDENNSNSAIVVNVTPDDFVAEGFSKDDILAGVLFQEKYEKLAYETGKGYIPVQLFGDFEAGIPSEKIGAIKPNIKGKYTLSNLNNCLPVYVKNAIIEGVHAYAKKLEGFDDKDAVLSGIESRTSSPVRMLRDDNFMSAITGIFPCGEGAGYAGGITSAAVDGIKVAEAVAQYING